MSPALLAGPLPNREVFDLLVLVPTAAAQLAAGEEGPYLHQGLMLPGRLVLELAGQLTPRGVSNGLGQLVIFEHAAYIETLHADDIVVPDQLCGELMQVVLPAVGNVLMLAGQAETGLLPVTAALWLSGQPPLENSELLLCFLQVLGVIVLLTIRGDDQILDAHIKADSGAGTGIS